MTIRIKILYFASLGDRLNCEEESLSLTLANNTILDLKQYLGERGEQWHSSLSDTSIRCAVNQALASDVSEINDGDEVAFFPPVTGG